MILSKKTACAPVWINILSGPFHAVVKAPDDFVAQGTHAAGQNGRPPGGPGSLPLVAFLHDTFTPQAPVHQRVHPFTPTPLKIFKLTGQVIDKGALLPEKTDAVIIPQVIADVHTEKGDGLLVLQQLPGNRRNVVDIVEMSDEKEKHGSISNRP
jgi:hypothetical protein